MTDREQIIAAFAWNIRYAEALVADLTDETWCESAGPGLENHPAWTLGHLVSGADILAEDLGLEREMKPRWRELFERRGPGDPRLPDPDPASYPSIPDVMAEFRRQHERVARQWRMLPEDKLTAPPRVALRWRVPDDRWGRAVSRGHARGAAPGTACRLASRPRPAFGARAHAPRLTRRTHHARQPTGRRRNSRSDVQLRKARTHNAPV